MGDFCVGCVYSSEIDTGLAATKYTHQWKCGNKHFPFKYKIRYRGDDYGDYYIDDVGYVRPILGHDCKFFANELEEPKLYKLDKVDSSELVEVFN